MKFVTFIGDIESTPFLGMNVTSTSLTLVSMGSFGK